MLQQISEKCNPKVEKIWMHCPSLGEFEQGRPVIEALRKEYPHYPIVITFFSPSGFEVQQNFPGADYVFYLPEDTFANARAFVHAVNPRIALFVKYDFWLHYLKALRNARCSTLLVSGIFRSNQHFFGMFPQLGQAMLQCFDHFFVQNEESVRLLQNAGYDNVTLSGDSRFDRVKLLAEKAETLPIVEQFCRNHFTVVAGSTWPADEALLFPVINQKEGKKWIIAPHEIGEDHLKSIERKLGVSSVRYSQASHSNLEKAQVLIIDNIGLLSRMYRYASIAYIGGGFGKSIHNILEAATWGVPLMFGPRHEKFEEALELILLGVAREVNRTADIDRYISEYANNRNQLQQVANESQKYVAEKVGATTKILTWIESNKVLAKES